MENENVGAEQTEIDESICIICGGSTYHGETISCETCLLWFHFQCVGVTHEDDCVRMEDVPYYCPTCFVQVKKEKRSKKSNPRTKAAKPSKPKPAKSRKSPKANPQSSQTEGLKLKISLKNPHENVEKSPKKRSFVEDLHLPEPKLSEDSDSSVDMPLIIDEIAPRTVKVGRRRPSQRQSGGEEPVKSEERFGLEIHQENMQVLLQNSKKESMDQSSVVVEERGELGEEERWLAAVQEGNIEKVQQEDAELRSVRDPKSLTARQKAMLNEGIELCQPLDFGTKKKVESKEDLAEKAIKAQKRREVESEKKEKMKQKTMDTLLKKKESKIAKQLKTVKSVKEELPRISYVRNQNGAFLSFPDNMEYPLERQQEKPPPEVINCCVCSNAKKYSCSKTGRPLCSLACYKENLQILTVS